MARTAEAAEVPSCQQPPETCFLHPRQVQMPAACLLTASLPQKEQVYVACAEISNLLATFLREAPYRVPYLPVIPTYKGKLYVVIRNIYKPSWFSWPYDLKNIATGFFKISPDGD